MKKGRTSSELLHRQLQEDKEARLADGRLSNEGKRRIAEAVDHGIPIREISRTTGISRSAIQGYAAAWRKGCSIPAAERKVGPDEKRVLKKDLQDRPQATAVQRKEKLAKVCGCFVSEGTVLRHAYALGYDYDRDRGIWVHATDERPHKHTKAANEKPL